MRFVNTVLGPLDASCLGNVLSHEHVACYCPAMLDGFGKQWFDRELLIERATRLFRQAKEECGVATIIDATPLDLGRNVDIIREVSKRSSVNVIVSSGMYCYDDLYLSGKKPEKFSQYFIRECMDGIKDSGVKPGILKCATGVNGVTPINRMLLTTMSLVQKETGLPLYAHNEHNKKTALEQIKIFENIGVEPDRIVIGHCSDTYDTEYLKELLRFGAYLGFDRIYPAKYREQAKTMIALIEQGYEDMLLVSHDYCAFIDHGDMDWDACVAATDRDFTTVHKKLLPCLKEYGASDKQLRKLVEDNPRRMLAGE